MTRLYVAIQATASSAVIVRANVNDALATFSNGAFAGSVISRRRRGRDPVWPTLAR